MVIAIIGMMSWPPVYRYCRAEMLRVRELSFIEAARAGPIPEWRILFRHALPHTLAPVTTELAFLAGASIIAESSLSFLGIGLPDHVVTWGSRSSSGDNNLMPGGWWFFQALLFLSLCCVLTFLLNESGRIVVFRKYLHPYFLKSTLKHSKFFGSCRTKVNNALFPLHPTVVNSHDYCFLISQVGNFEMRTKRQTLMGAVVILSV